MAKTSSAAAPWTNPERSDVGTPRGACERRDAGGDHLREHRGAGLPDDQRCEHGGDEPHAVQKEGVDRDGRGRRGYDAPDDVPGREHDAEHDTDHGRDEDVARPPRLLRRSPRGPGLIDGSHEVSTSRYGYAVLRARTASVEPGPASFAGTSRIRFRGSVVGPHSQRACAPRRRSSVARDGSAGPQPATPARFASRLATSRLGWCMWLTWSRIQSISSAMTLGPAGSLWSSWRTSG